jgi:flavin reductase (DIM6/NTAB) family NADH-FMN oxidoreductase RutF
VAVSPDQYKSLGRAAAGAVSVVAVRDEAAGQVVALTVSSFVTLSLEPPLVMFAIQQHAESYAPIVTSKAFGVSLLNAGQIAVARQMSQKGRAKTAGFPFASGTSLAVPLVDGSLAQVECRTQEIVLSGDHAIVVGRVEAIRTGEGDPLLYSARRFGTFRPLEDA